MQNYNLLIVMIIPSLAIAQSPLFAPAVNYPVWSSPVYVSGDVSCNYAFNGNDVSFMAAYFKSRLAPIPRTDCP
jgi:hypothetical protein